MRVLVVNAGSSSLKLRILDGEEVVASRDLPPPGDGAGAGALIGEIRDLGRADAVGHRIVHGGTDFSRPVVIDDGVVQRLHELIDLAPLHQPKSLAGLGAVSAALPGVPAVACFDTAFHSTIPPAAATYGLPREWRDRWRIKRYGFHGLSHEYASRRVAHLIGRPVEDLRTVTCHLGAGASLAAVDGGRSVDTTMGFTPLEGLVMATRSGSLDPGLVLWLEEHAGVPPADLSRTLETESGLVGLAGTADMREVVSRAAAGDAAAGLALDVYVHRLRSLIAAMAAATGGLDVLVFTGGVGEHAAEVRARAAAGLGFLGVRLDRDANEGAGGDTEIGGAGGSVRVYVIAAREDLEIARQTRAVLGG